jgi:hypothetical protein
MFLLGGPLNLNPQSLMILFTVQAIWYLAVAGLLIRRML